jgi:hypothetical protein
MEKRDGVNVSLIFTKSRVASLGKEQVRGLPISEGER